MRRPYRVERRFSQRMSLALSDEQYDELIAAADRFEVSLSALVRRAVALGLPREIERLKRLGGVAK